MVHLQNLLLISYSCTGGDQCLHTTHNVFLSTPRRTDVMSSFNVMSSFTIDFSKIARGHFCGDFRSLYDIFRFLQFIGDANAATAGFGMLTDSVR